MQLKLNQKEVKQFISAVKKKKELSTLDDKFIFSQLQEYLKRNPKMAQVILSNNIKAKDYKILIKDIRSKLRRLYGLFRNKKETSEIKELLSKLSLEKSSKKRKLIITEILNTHASTKERLNDYTRLYKKIFSMTGNPKSIIDLGCGINPFSVELMNLPQVKYYSYDISTKEINLIQDYFKSLKKINPKLQGQAEVVDIKETKKLPAADVALMFKVTDILDQGKGHKETEKVISNLKVKYLVISFPTVTMSGKKMNFPRRKWIELLSDRLGYSWKIIEYSNEIFYVIDKSVGN